MGDNEMYSSLSEQAKTKGGPEVDFHEGFSGNMLSLVHLSPYGPKVEFLGSGSSPLEQNAIPTEQLTKAQRDAIEALPVLRSGAICAPLTSEEAKRFGPGPIYYCDLRDTSELSQEKQMLVRQGDRVHLRSGDKVAKTEDGYLIIHPLLALD